MKVHLFDSWHLPHFTNSKDSASEGRFDLLTLLAFVIGMPPLILGVLSLVRYRLIGLCFKSEFWL